MRIAVFGLGYVGVVSAVCLAEQGHEILGVDVNSSKVDAVNGARSPIVEPEVDGLLRSAVRSGRLKATTDAARAVAESDMAWLCVGTPSLPSGEVDRRHLADVARQIGRALRGRRGRYTVVVRSTAIPGTARGVVAVTIADCSGRSLGDGWGICSHPEFLREGAGVSDFRSGARIVIGAGHPEDGVSLASLYSGSGVPLVRCSVEMAEMVKYADNAWHALKVAFANEIGTVSDAAGLDGTRLMEILCLDRVLNLSEHYLRPGFAFGGSCLPKDLRALAYEGRRLDLDLPLLSAILPSNERHLDRALRTIVGAGARRIGLVGLSFKAGTDDMRESPFVELAERLIGKGFQLRVFDPEINLSLVTGANRQFIETRIPHIASLLVGTLDEAVRDAELVVVGHLEPSRRDRLAELLGNRSVIDLSGALR